MQAYTIPLYAKLCFAHPAGYEIALTGTKFFRKLPYSLVCTISILSRISARVAGKAESATHSNNEGALRGVAVSQPFERRQRSSARYGDTVSALSLDRFCRAKFGRLQQVRTRQDTRFGPPDAFAVAPTGETAALLQ